MCLVESARAEVMAELPIRDTVRTVRRACEKRPFWSRWNNLMTVSLDSRTGGRGELAVARLVFRYQTRTVAALRPKPSREYFITAVGDDRMLR